MYCYLSIMISKIKISQYLLSWLLTNSLIFFAVNIVWAIEISNKPMETTIQAAPSNIMFVFDNSGSMDWEFMTPEDHGIFHYKYYVFRDNDYLPDPDHAYNGSTSIFDSHLESMWKSQWSGYNKLYYNPLVRYYPWPSMPAADIARPRANPELDSPVFNLANIFMEVHNDSSFDDYGDSMQDASWVSCGNLLANFETEGDHDWFKIVLGSSGTLTVRTFSTSDCTDTLGRILDSNGNPYRTNEYPDPKQRDWTDNHIYSDDCKNPAYCGSSCWGPNKDWNFYISLANVSAGTYYIDIMEYKNDGTGTYKLYIDFDGTCNDPPPTPPSPVPVVIYNAHYYAWADNETGGTLGQIDIGEIYLVNFEDTNNDGVLDSRHYYRFFDYNNNDHVEFGELIPVSDIPEKIKAKKIDDNGNFLGYMSFDEELQNFANWFSYYRRRELTAKAAVATAISQLTGVNIGIYTINSDVRQPVLYVNSHRDELYSKLFSVNSHGGTPLRRALRNVGRYFDADDGRLGGLGNAPWASEADGGACQQAFAIIMTDGYWNGYSPNVGNVDGSDGIPFADDYSNTLADVARYFYDSDLNDNLPDIVPPNACDDNTRQHLVTYGLSFGVKGELNPSYDSYHPCLLDVINNDPNAPPAPVWEDPNSCYACGKKIDDLWHAAVNGRGAFISAGDPEQLIQALGDIIANINGRMASGAAVSINSEKLTEGTMLYQSSYDSTDWTGDLKAYSLNAQTGELSDPVWSAKNQLLDQDWDNGRRIITFNGTSGIPFRWDQMTPAQKMSLDNNNVMQQKIIKFIRGKDIPGFRSRPVIDNKVDKLGDLVHSAPTLVGSTIYVGGNDGMLHAFDANQGVERFAFVPNNLMHQLKELTVPGYSHRFFVDLTPTVKLDVPSGNNLKTILVGGLGAGGKGYFALDITNADSIDQSSSESQIANMVLWEYPSSGNDPDLGLSMSKVSIVKTQIGSYVAIFGNGYNSDNGHAILYILDLLTGNIIKKIDTGVGGDNGLSTPVVVDVDGDFIADFAYAGDLKGNLWKFDLRGDPSQWKAAFGNKPLFQAINQPITVRPDVMRHCSQHGYMVVFGTGKFLAPVDLQDTSVQTIYGIWDYTDTDLESEYVGAFDASTETFTPSPELQGNNVTLLKQTINDVVTNEGISYRLFSNNSANWSTIPDSLPDHLPDPGSQNGNSTVGWYVNLGGIGYEGERAGRDIVIRNGKAIVITVIPNDSPCSGGGKSVLYEMDACDGSRPEKPVFDVNGDTNLNEEDLLASGGGNSPPEPPTGRVFETIVHDPVFLRIPNDGNGGPEQEFKYFSTAQGTIIRVREPADYLGIYYWIEW